VTPEEEKEYQAIANAIAKGANNYHNYDSIQNFDSTLNMDDGESVLNMDYGARMASPMSEKGLSTYNFTVFYTDNSGSGDVVDVTLFRSYFNEGVFVGDDLVFTNSAGDTATVRGRTVGFRQFQNRAETQTSRIGFTRQKPVDDAQFDQEIEFLYDSVYGGGKFNNIVPEEFITPEQFQLLRVDIPMRFDVNGERGWRFNLNATEILASGGCRFTLFVNRIMDPSRAIKGKNPVVELDNPRGIADSAPAASLQEQIETLQQLKINRLSAGK